MLSSDKFSVENKRAPNQMGVTGQFTTIPDSNRCNTNSTALMNNLAYMTRQEHIEEEQEVEQQDDAGGEQETEL